MSITFIKLEEAQIGNICSSLQQKKIGLTNISFRYSVSNKEIFLINAYGYPNMLPDNESYYQNVEDHISYAYLRWLGPMMERLSRNFKVNIDANVPVRNDGSFEHDKVDMRVSASIFSKTNRSNEQYTISKKFFERVLPFYKYLDSVEFKSHKYELNQIAFHMNLDGINVFEILKNPTYNQKILAQWLATLDNFIDNSKGEYKVHSILDIINGKMNAHKYQSSTSFHFTHDINEDNGKWNQTGESRGGQS